MSVGETRTKKLRVTMIAGEPPVSTDPGVPVEVNQPWHDETFRGLQCAVHRPIIGLAHKRDTVVLPDHYAIADEHMCVSIEANYRATLKLCAHKYPPFYCPVRFMLSWRD
jgi:hypothetical protein